MQTSAIEGFQLSLQQQQLWQLQQADSSLPYRVQGAVLIEGDLVPIQLETALQQIVERHEILRTTFPRVAGMDVPLQAIANHHQLNITHHDLSKLDPSTQQLKLEGLFVAAKQQLFNFELGEVFSISLIKLAASKHILLLGLPALCADAVTLENLVREIQAAYTSCLQDTDAPLQYADFAAWQNDLLAAAEAEIGRKFWQNQDISSAFTTKLPIERQVRENYNFQPQVITTNIQPQQGFELEKIAKNNNISLSTLLLCCWQILLWRLTGSDIVTGTAYDGRNYEELTSALGLFALFLPVQTHLEDAMPLAEVWQQVSETLQEVETWQEFFTWEDLKGKPDQVSFFPFCFDFIEMQKQIETNDVTFSIEQQYSCTQRFDLKLVCVRHQDVLSLEIHYNTQRFHPEAIQQLAAQLQILLLSVVATPTAAIAELEILSAQQRQQLLVEFNRTTLNYPPTQSIQQLFEAQVQQHPHQIAVVYETQQLTYEQLNQRANQLANYLQQLGVQAEVPVGVCVERSLEMLIAVLAVLKAGGAYVPFEPTLPAAALALRLADVSAPIVLTTQSLVSQISADNTQVICLDTDSELIAALPLNNPTTNITAENLAYILYTSGSSGQPKGVAVEHRQLLNYVYSIQHRLDLQASFSYALVSTLAADLGNTMIFGALCTGGCLHILSKERATDPDALAEYCQKHPIDCLKIVPTHLKALLVSEAAKHFLPRQRLIIGGEAIDWQLIAQLQPQLAASCQIFNHYGPTEATIGVLTHRIPTQASSSIRATVPLGRPLANTQVYLLSSALQPVAMGVVGELYIGGANVARGYWKRPELTAQRFIPSPFDPQVRLYKTGDYARYLPDGTIEFCGRIDFQVKLHGFRVELAEVESVLKRHPAVQDAVVVLPEDELQQRRLVAYVVLHHSQSFNPSELRQFLLSTLPEYMVPAVLVRLQSLPLSLNGKVDRQALPEPAATSDLHRNYIAPRTRTEEILVDIWTQVLGVEQVGIHDNFFELGGDSIQSIQAIAKASQAGLKLTPRQLFQHQTIAELAQVAKTSVFSANQVEQGLVTGAVPLTPVQQRFFQQNLLHPHHWNQAVLLEVKQILNFEWLVQAVGQLLKHHDALRLRFHLTAAGWQQVNADLDTAIPCWQVDLSGLTATEQKKAIAAAANKLQISFNLSAGVLLRVVLFDLGADQPARLLIVIHHLAVDGISWRILLEDLQTAYQQLAHAQSLQLPPKTASFKQWAEQLHNYASSKELAAELNYWLKSLPEQVAKLPVDYANGTNTIASAQVISVTLTADETQTLLQTLPAVYRTQINDVLLTALVQSFSQWTGSPSLLLDLESHGREANFDDLDISRTVGWFTSIFAVHLELKESDSEAALKIVKQQLQQIPHQGIGYGLLRYLNHHQQLTALPQAEVIFNYLGQFDQALSESSLFKLAIESSGQSRSLQAWRHHLLEINSYVTGGQLRLDWTYSEAIHRRETIENLTQNFLNNLRSLIIHCQSSETSGYTPGDFPLAKLNQSDLDKLIARITQAGGGNN